MEQHHVSATGTKQTEALSCKVHKTCTGAKKNTNFELQSAPNLRRDKNNKVLNFKVHQTCAGTKKNKNTKTSQSIWGGATIPLKCFFFWSLCRFGALWSSKLLLFFGPVQVWCTLKFKTFVFFSLCRFGEL